MKTRSIFAGALALMVALSSCSKDAEGPQGGGSGGSDVVEGLSTLATLRISQYGRPAGSYAANDYVNNPDQPVTGETELKSVKVLVFSNDVLAQIENFEAADIQAKAKTFVTTTGAKKFYALANFDAAKLPADDDLKGKKLADVQKTVVEVANVEELTKNAEFWMTNVYPEGAVDEPQKIIEQADETAVAGGKNNVTIYIGRASVKVTPALGTTQATGGELVNANYRMRQNPTRFYLFPVYEAGVTGKIGTYNQLLTPYYNSNVNFAYNGVDNKDSWASTNGAQVAKTVDYFHNGAPANVGDEPTFVAFGTHSYITENANAAEIRHKGAYISVKGTFNIKIDEAVFVNPDGTKNDAHGYTQGADFWRVAKINAEGQIEYYCAGVYTEDIVAQAPAKVIDLGSDGWHKTIAFKPANDPVAPGVAENAKDWDATAYKAVYYKDATSYYGLHLADNRLVDVPNKYSVKRNNSYKVNITSIAGPGDASEEDVTNKPGDIEQDAHMQATIEVLPWRLVEQEGGI